MPDRLRMRSPDARAATAGYLPSRLWLLRPNSSGAARLLVAALLAGLSLIQHATAQQGGEEAVPPGTQLPEASTPLPFPSFASPAVEHVLDDSGGVRDILERRGVSLLLDAVTEFAGNVDGGIRQGATFANQVTLQADIDWEHLAGFSGFSTHTILVNRSGSSDSHLFGDNLLPVQEVYGAGGNVVVHLVSLYAQQTLSEGLLDIAGGRMLVSNDFAGSPLYCNFMSNALCGHPLALPGGDIGYSAFPDAVWAARIRSRPFPGGHISAGVYEVNQGLYDNSDYRSAFVFHSARDSGVYLPVELGYDSRLGSGDLPGHFVAGFGYDTSTYRSFPTSVGVASGSGGTLRHANSQLWLLADQKLANHGKQELNGIVAFCGFIHNDPRNSRYSEQFFVGLLDSGFWPGRIQDTVGILINYNTVSDRLARTQAEELQLGLPLSDSATGIQGHETVAELNYDFHLHRGIYVQPDLQYVMHPNAQMNIHDALVVGFKAHASF